MYHRVLFLFFIFALGVGGWSFSARAEIPCIKILPGAEVPAGFGAPYSTESSSFPTLSGQCGKNAFTVEAGNWDNTLYIYKYGYAWNTALKKWERFEFRGARPRGEWLEGHASASLSRSLGELRQNNYALAYMCKKTNGAWKCGCRDSACAVPYWQIQAYSIGDTHEAVFSVPVLPPVSEVLVTNLSAMSGMPGTMLSIFGSGFSSSNMVLFNEKRVTGVLSQDGKTITLRVPDIPFGRYTVRVENEHGVSAYPMDFAVTRANASPPRVEKVFPEQVKIGGVVTLYGANFSPTNNSVFTGFEWVDGIPSKDGVTLSLKTDLFKGQVTGQAANLIRKASSTSSAIFPVVLTVANENGVAFQGPTLIIEL